MIQVFLRNAAGAVTRIITDINDLSTALNDQNVLTQPSIIGLLDYLARNHFHTKIGEVPYYLSNVTMGIGKPVIIVFTELNQPNSGIQYRVILRDSAGNDTSDSIMDKAGIAAMLNDQNILNTTDEAQLELYLISHHYLTRIDGISYMHTNYSVGLGQLPTFVFEER